MPAEAIAGSPLRRAPASSRCRASSRSAQARASVASGWRAQRAGLLAGPAGHDQPPVRGPGSTEPAGDFSQTHVGDETDTSAVPRRHDHRHLDGGLHPQHERADSFAGARRVDAGARHAGLPGLRRRPTYMHLGEGRHRDGLEHDEGDAERVRRDPAGDEHHHTGRHPRHVGGDDGQHGSPRQILASGQVPDERRKREKAGARISEQHGWHTEQTLEEGRSRGASSAPVAPLMMASATSVRRRNVDAVGMNDLQGTDG